MKVKNHTISKPPPVHSAADRQAAEQRHKGAGKGPEKPFSHALSEAQEKHRMNSSCEEGAQKPERSVPLDPRMLRAIGHEAATTQHESAQEQQGAPAQASRSHSRLSITDTNYGLGGKKSEHVQRLLLAHRAKLDEGQRVIRHFSQEMDIQLAIVRGLKAMAWEAKKLLSQENVTGAAKCIENMEGAAVELSKRVQDARKGKFGVDIFEENRLVHETEIAAERIARMGERERAIKLFCVRIGHRLNQPVQGILGNIDLAIMDRKNRQNIEECLNAIIASIKDFEERATKIRDVKEIKEAHYDAGVKMLHVE